MPMAVPKYASTSAARFFSVRPSVMIAVTGVLTPPAPLLVDLDRAPALSSALNEGADNALYRAPPNSRPLTVRKWPGLG